MLQISAEKTDELASDEQDEEGKGAPEQHDEEHCMLNANSGPLSPPICTCLVENDHILGHEEGLALWEERRYGQRGQNHERRIRTYSVKRERNTSKPYKKEKTK